jgi:hypothetical protein
MGYRSFYFFAYMRTREREREEVHCARAGRRRRKEVQQTCTRKEVSVGAVHAKESRACKVKTIVNV